MSPTSRINELEASSRIGTPSGERWHLTRGVAPPRRVTRLSSTRRRRRSAGTCTRFGVRSPIPDIACALPALLSRESLPRGERQRPGGRAGANCTTAWCAKTATCHEPNFKPPDRRLNAHSFGAQLRRVALNSPRNWRSASSTVERAVCPSTVHLYRTIGDDVTASRSSRSCGCSTAYLAYRSKPRRLGPRLPHSHARPSWGQEIPGRTTDQIDDLEIETTRRS